MPEDKQPEVVALSIATALGADGGLSSQCFSVYIPNKDQQGQEIGNQRKWVLEAIRLLSEINGGASGMPSAIGRKDDRGSLRRLSLTFLHPISLRSEGPR